MIVIASDHAGFELKRHLVLRLEARSLEVGDLGVHDETSADYPDLAHTLADAISGGRAQRGILICGTGIGMSMAANRHPGIRAALCHDAFTAEMARRHNDANVLCMGARVLGTGVAEQVLDLFLATPFEGGRHARRTGKIELAARLEEP